ncbi:MAG: EamA family transporter [Bacteroidales bacterium]|nr:EamA family transporter [Bacteroidales bacterium]
MWKVIPLALLQSMFLCGGQVMLKLALARMGQFRWEWSFFASQLTNWWFPGCGLAFGAATVLWMHMLKNYPFGVAYPVTSISYLFGVVAAFLIFHEEVTLSQWAGVLLIMAGCVLIAK